MQYEKERGDGREIWKKDNEENWKTARDTGVYTFEKAAGRAMPDVLPKEAALNPTKRRLAWKQERAGILPRRRLLTNLDLGKKVALFDILERRFKRLLHQGPLSIPPERLIRSPSTPPPTLLNSYI